MTIKKDNANGGVGSSPVTPNTPEKKDYTIAVIIGLVILTIIICALV